MYGRYVDGVKTQEKPKRDNNWGKRERAPTGFNAAFNYYVVDVVCKVVRQTVSKTVISIQFHMRHTCIAQRTRVLHNAHRAPRPAPLFGQPAVLWTWGKRDTAANTHYQS